jgi:hypothetical protein
MTEQSNKMLEIAFKILSVLIIPILLWVNSISVDIALINKTMSDHTEGLNECKGQIVKVQLNTQALEEIKNDLARTQSMLEDIRRILLESRTSGR